MARSLDPQVPFEDYEEADYIALMDFINRVESVQAVRLGNWLADKLAPNSVIDVGCGPGIYLVPFALRGKRVFGIDACPTGGEWLRPEQFERVDLRFPYKARMRFDLALCLEVAEHLEAKWAERLVDTLCDCADTILFTGATPGQGGTNHYNEQPHAYWLDLFATRHGYVVHPLQDAMRAFVNTLPDHCSDWLKRNSFLLTRTSNAKVSS